MTGRRAASSSAVALGCLVALAACSKKPSADHEPEASAPKPAAAPDALPTLDGKLDCAQVLPAALIERHFAGAKLSTGLNGSCKIERGQITELVAGYDCSTSMDADTIEMFLSSMANASRIPGLGRGAAADDLHLRAFDDDTACKLSLTYAGKFPGLEPFVKDALDVLTPERLPTIAVAK